MKPNCDDEIREFSYGEFLKEIGDRATYSGKESVQRKDLVIIMQAVFGYEDERTWRRKISMCVAKGWLEQKNKTAYRLTDLGYERIRMARGVPPEAKTEATIADDNTDAEVFETNELSTRSDVDGYLNALRRGGA